MLWSEPPPLLRLDCLQAIVVGFVAASVGVFQSVIITSAILGAYIGLAYAVFLSITWAINGYFLPLWARRSGYVVAAAVVAGGLILSLYEYFAEKRSDLAIIFFSLAYWVIAISLFGAGVTRLAAVGAFSSGADVGSGENLQVSAAASPFLSLRLRGTHSVSVPLRSSLVRQFLVTACRSQQRALSLLAQPPLPPVIPQR